MSRLPTIERAVFLWLEIMMLLLEKKRRDSMIGENVSFCIFSHISKWYASGFISNFPFSRLGITCRLEVIKSKDYFFCLT